MPNGEPDLKLKIYTRHECHGVHFRKWDFKTRLPNSEFLKSGKFSFWGYARAQGYKKPFQWNTLSVTQKIS